jgi:hypothetical protein
MAARGMNASNVSAADEILRQYQLGQQLLQQRQQFATGVVGTNQGFYGDALSRVLGLTSGSGTGATQGAASVGSGVGSQPFNLQSLMNSYTSDLYNTNLNMQASGAIANANNTNALIGAGIGAIGNIAGAI